MDKKKKLHTSKVVCLCCEESNATKKTYIYKNLRDHYKRAHGSQKIRFKSVDSLTSSMSHFVIKGESSANQKTLHSGDVETSLAEKQQIVHSGDLDISKSMGDDSDFESQSAIGDKRQIVHSCNAEHSTREGM